MEIKALSNVLEYKCDTLVLGVYDDSQVGENFKKIDNMMGGLITKVALQEDKFEGRFCASYVMQTYGKIPAKKILLVGLGHKQNFNNNKLRELCAKTQRLLNTLKSEIVCIALDTDIDEKSYAEFTAIGFLTGEYSFDKYKNNKTPKRIKEVYINTKEEKSIEKGVKIANATSKMRDLANEPAQVITPEKLAEYAKKIKGVDVEILEPEQIEKEGMNAYLAVGRGSIHTPRFIKMHYKPANPKKTIALIGKGITFDSGGMDLKPAASMLTMRDDMSGAAVVIEVMGLLTEFKPDIEVWGLVAACENMISGKAYKPGDILTARNKKTIEVENTDAEGRITLADALCYASDLKVDEIIDIATLTGACMVALGYQCAGLLGNSSELMDKIQKVAEHQGENFWQLPMLPEYFDMLKSDVADMKNTGGRWGGASSAALFLQEFVDPEIKWAHLDIAGTAFLDRPQKDLIKGATGIGVRTLINYILGE